ncbi:hypothetical protein [Flagellimonas sp.]|uniref:hypothetical protein n=1 Tax=Flagellimonas sp. TaxID=2058762 RepID=UPI003AB3E030
MMSEVRLSYYRDNIDFYKDPELFNFAINSLKTGKKNNLIGESAFINADKVYNTFDTVDTNIFPSIMRPKSTTNDGLFIFAELLVESGKVLTKQSDNITYLQLRGFSEALGYLGVANDFLGLIQVVDKYSDTKTKGAQEDLIIDGLKALFALKYSLIFLVAPGLGLAGVVLFTLYKFGAFEVFDLAKSNKDYLSILENL